MSLRKSADISVYQYLAAFTACLNVINSGMHYGWASPSLPKLLHESSHIPLTDDEGSWVAVMMLFGAIVGAVTNGFLLDRLGRKFTILLAAVPFFAAWILVAFAASVEVLYVARILAGIGDGLSFTAIPMYLGEIADSKVRGFFGTSISVAALLGMLIINAVGSYMSIKATALTASVLPVLVLLSFVWMPESPYYYIMKERYDLAQKSLYILKGREDKDELNRLIKAVEEQNSHQSRFWDLFTVKSNRRACYIVMGIRAIQQFSGSMAITFYAQIIFQETPDVISPTTASLLYFGIQLVMAGLSSALVDKAGRRPLMIISLTGSGLMMLLEGTVFLLRSRGVDIGAYSVVPILALLIYIASFSVGMQTIPVCLIGELFPTDVKAFAVCSADVYFAVMLTAASKFFQITKDELGLHVPFYCFSIVCVLGLLFVIFYVPETKGKSLEEIQEILKGEKRAKSDSH